MKNLQKAGRALEALVFTPNLVLSVVIAVIPLVIIAIVRGKAESMDMVRRFNVYLVNRDRIVQSMPKELRWFRTIVRTANSLLLWLLIFILSR